MLRISEIKWYSDLRFGFISFIVRKPHNNKKFALESVTHLSILFDGHIDLNSGCYARFFIGEKYESHTRHDRSNFVEII